MIGKSRDVVVLLILTVPVVFLGLDYDVANSTKNCLRANIGGVYLKLIYLLSNFHKGTLLGSSFSMSLCKYDI